MLSCSFNATGMKMAYNHVERCLAKLTGLKPGSDGIQSAAARMLGVSPQAVSNWVRDGYVTPERAFELETVTAYPRQKLMDPELVNLVCHK
jgi:DNA-binding transcriptional regulator YdaS (Cro superfamily)